MKSTEPHTIGILQRSFWDLKAARNIKKKFLVLTWY